MGRTGINVIWLFVCCVIRTSLGELDNTRNGTIRLADGGGPYRGRVEMYANGEWGTICDDSWDENDARVVCRELGFNTTIVSAYHLARFGLGSGPIFLDEVRCRGNETRIWDCPANPLLDHDCNHGEDASVSCGLDCEDGSYISDSTCVLCSNCENQTCHYMNGTCTLGCVSGFYGDRCDANCSSITPSCLVCDRDDGQCTACSDRLKPPQCTVCADTYYNSSVTCVLCSINCVNRLCDPANGRCTLACPTGFYGDTCQSLCSAKTASCIHCEQDSGLCTECSDNLKSPDCTVCADTYYNSSATCVLCSINCVNRLCDPANGRRTLGCPTGFYGDTCQSLCSAKTASCIHCEQDSGLCTGCSDNLKSPDCTVDNDKDNDSLVGPIVGAIVSSILGAGLLIAVAIWCRRKSNRSAGKATPVETASVPANNLSDSAITGPHPPPLSSSTPGVEGNIYKIEDNDNDTNNGRTLPTASPPSSSTAGDEGRHYENVVQVNTYDKFSPYANVDRVSEMYTELDVVTTKT